MGVESDILKKPIMSFQHNVNVYVIWTEVRKDKTMLSYVKDQTCDVFTRSSLPLIMKKYNMKYSEAINVFLSRSLPKD